MADEEQPLAEFQGVRHKKQNGVLLVTSLRVAWSQGEIFQSAQLSYKYSQIKSQRISPEKSSKVQLQLILRSGSSQVNFHFTGQTALPDRDRAKVLIQQLLAKVSTETNPELAQKANLFSSQPELHQLYKDLVVGGLITAEEFWANRLNQGMGGASEQQESGLPSAFLADVHAVSDGCNALRFNLTPEIQHAIFKTYPTVRAKHALLVPDQMSEEEFWKQFFQSQFFHKDAATSGRSFLSDCLSQEQQNLLESGKNSGVTLNITETARHHLSEEGYSVYAESATSSGPSSQSAVLQRCNLHSTMVLKALHSSTPSTPSTQGAQSMESGEEVVSLKLRPSQLTSDQVAPATSMFGLLEELGRWDGKTIDHTHSQSAVSHMMPGGSLMTSSSGCGRDTLSHDQRVMVFRHTSAVTELLRHFWSCFPVRTSQLEEKVHRMYKCLQEYNEGRFDELLSALGHSDDYRVVEHLRVTVRLAVSQYHSWQAKRSTATKIS